MALLYAYILVYIYIYIMMDTRTTKNGMIKMQ
jgi:hypothetical protein